MASSCKYFDEDCVYRVTKRGKFKLGLVLENAEYASSDDEDSTVPLWDRIKQGDVRVAWHPTGTEEVIHDGKVGLADRALMPGDIVRRVLEGKDTQLGVCNVVSIKVALQPVLCNDSIIMDVPTELLSMVEQISEEVAVYFDAWVALVRCVHKVILLRLTDGSLCEADDSALVEFRDTNRKRAGGEFDQDLSFYVGQKLIGPASALKNCKWLQGSAPKEHRKGLRRTHRLVRAVVEKVTVESVELQELCRAFSKSTLNPKFPSVVRGGDILNIRQIDAFRHCNYQMGDLCVYTIREVDQPITMQEFRARTASSCGIQLPAAKRNAAAGAVVEGQGDTASATRVLATGGEEVRPIKDAGEEVNKAPPKHEGEGGDSSSEFEDIPSQDEGDDRDDLTSVTSYGSSCVFPQRPAYTRRRKRGSLVNVGGNAGGFHLGSGTKSKGSRRRGDRVGTGRSCASAATAISLTPGQRVVCEVISTATTCSVIWQDGTEERGISSRDLYPICHLDNHEFFPGDFVVEDKGSQAHEYCVVSKVDHTGRTAIVKKFRCYTTGTEQSRPEELGEEEVSVYDIRDHPDFKYRPGSCVIRVGNFPPDAISEESAGQIWLSHPTGQVEVQWLTGKREMCYPQDLFHVGDYDSDDLWDDGGDGEEDDQFEDGEGNETLNCALMILQGDTRPSSSDDEWETDDDISDNEQENQTPISNRTLRRVDGGGAAVAVSESSLGNLLEANGMPSADVTQVIIQDFDHIIALWEKVVDALRMIENHVRCGEHGRIKPFRVIQNLHKSCKMMDELLGTHFFAGLSLEPAMQRLRAYSANQQNMAERVASQMSRLFSPTDAEMSPRQGDIGTEESDGGGAMAASPASLVKSPTMELQPEEIQIICDVIDRFKTVINKVRDYIQQVYRRGVGMSAAMTTVGIGEIDLTTATTVPSDFSLRGSSIATEIAESVLADSKDDLSDVTVTTTAQTQDGAHGAVVRSAMQDDLKASSEMLQTASAFQLPVQAQKLVDAGNNATVPEMGVSSVSGNKTDVTSLPAPDVVVTKEDDIMRQLESEANASRGEGVFEMLESAPPSHKFKLAISQPSDPKNFMKTVRREMSLLRSSLPAGVWVKAYTDRLDLFSVMIRGPKKTPYEDGLFFFDFSLPNTYPADPPLCHYWSFCTDRLNPNLYEGGKVCVSLLGTWSGHGTQVWSSQRSTLLQVIISLQGLILNSEPYFNEAGYDNQRKTQQGEENSRMYNEMVILKVVQAMGRVIENPPVVFKAEVEEHFKANIKGFIDRLKSWLWVSLMWPKGADGVPLPTNAAPSFAQILAGCADADQSVAAPEFSLLPASKGFCLTLRKSLSAFEELARAHQLLL